MRPTAMLPALALLVTACGGDPADPGGAVAIDVGGARASLTLAYRLGDVVGSDHVEFRLPPSASAQPTVCTIGQACEIALQWMEHGREARVEIRLTSDATHWWSDVLRIYDDTGTGTWIEFSGSYFHTPHGQVWSGEKGVGTATAAITLEGTIEAYVLD